MYRTYFWPHVILFLAVCYFLPHKDTGIIPLFFLLYVFLAFIFNAIIHETLGYILRIPHIATVRIACIFVVGLVCMRAMKAALLRLYTILVNT